MCPISFYKPYDTKKENILFLHGFLENSNTWNPFIDELSQTYNCLFYDFPGHGTNQNFPINRIDFTHISSEIIEGLLQFNITKTHIVCHSMGGYFGCFLKANHHEVFHKLVICNAILEPDSDAQLKKRNKIIRILKTNQTLLCKLSFNELKHAIRKVKEVACLSCNPEHLVNLQKLMAQRPDFTNLYTKYPNDLFFIFGEYDSQIPWETTKQRTKKRQCILQNEGHTLPLNSIEKWVRLVHYALK